MSKPNDEAEESEDDIGIHRLEAFTDAVVAIVMTLLALDIRLPVEAAGLSNAQLIDALIEMAPRYSAYALSFLVTALFYVIHTRKLRIMNRSDGPFFRINILFYMALGTIPFATSLIAENGNAIATTLYAGVMAVVSFILAGMSAYALGRGLVAPKYRGEGRTGAVLRSAYTGIVFLVSIPIALFVDEDIAKYFWLLLLLSFAVRLQRRFRRS